jgi:hypothetical protein
MSDIKEMLEFVVSNPEEASENITAAKVLDMPAPVYRENKTDFQPVYDALKFDPNKTVLEKNPPEAVRNFASQSEEHLGLLKNNLPEHYWWTNQAKYIRDQVKGVDKNREAAMLAGRKMADPENWSEEDQIKLEALNIQREDYLDNDYGMTETWETLPGQVVAQGVDMVQGLWKNKDLILKSAGAGAAVGAVGASPGGPLASLAGGVSLGAKGAAVGALAAGFKDGYEVATGSVYNELDRMVDENGNAVGVPEETKRALARSVGIVSATIGTVVDVATAKTLPWVRRLVSPKAVKEIILDPRLLNLRTTMVSIGRALEAGGAGAAGEGATEIFTALAEEVGRTYDGSETSFTAALENVAQQLGTEDSEIRKRISQAALVGGAASGTFSGTAQAIGFRTTRAEFEEQSRFAQYIKTPAGKAELALRFADDLDAAQKISKQTDLGNYNRGELAIMRKDAFKETPDVWVSPEQIRVWAGSDEKKTQAVRELIDPAGIFAMDLEVPVRIPIEQYLAFKDDFPDADDFLQRDPDGPTVADAKAFIEAREQAEARRQNLLSRLGSEKMSETERGEITAQLELLNAGSEFDPNEQSYLNQPSFTERIRSVLPQAVVDQVEVTQRKIREQIADAIDDSAQNEMNEIVDIQTQLALEAEFESQLARIENNPNIDIAERFANPDVQNNPWLEEQRLPHHKPGFSPWAIDPRMLPENLKALTKDPILKKRKVFVKGGVNPYQAAQMLGASTPEKLLRILRETPTRQEIAEGRVEARRESIQQKVADSVDLNDTAISQTYENRAMLHLQEMKLLLDQSWPALKGQIRRIAKQVPRIDELRSRATKFIGATRIKDLNATQYAVGERRANAKAINAVTDGKIYDAWDYKERAALNVELERQTKIMTGEVNRAIRRMKRYTKADFRAVFEEAGTLGVLDELLEVVALRKTNAEDVRRNKFAAYVEKSIENGVNDLTIPDSMLDPRAAYDQFTVDEFLLIEDRMTKIYEQSLRKNLLLADLNDRATAQTVEMISAEVATIAEQHPDFDPNRIDEVRVPGEGRFARIIETIRDFPNLLKNAEYTALTLDRGKVAGRFYELLISPIRGEGKYKGYGLNGVTKDVSAFRARFEQAVKAYGEAEWRKIGFDVLDIPELRASKALKNGKLSRLDLLMLATYAGTDSGFDRLSNFGIEPQVWNDVFNKYLKEKDGKFIQNAIWNSYESFKPRVVEHQKITNGKPVKFLEPRKVAIGGKLFDGGYVPLVYNPDSVSSASAKKKIDQLAGGLAGDASLGVEQKFFDIENMTTDQSYTKNRTDNERVLDYSFENIGYGFEKVIYDLNMRIPTQDVMKLLADDGIRKSIVSIVGRREYDMLVSHVGAATRTKFEMNGVYGSADALVAKVLARVAGANSITMLAFNLGSAFIQFASVPNAWQRMGPNSGKYLVNVLGKVTNNIEMVPEFVQAAREIYPDLDQYFEQIDDNFVRTLLPMQPKQGSKTMALIEGAQQMVSHAGMSPLAYNDMIQKTTVVLAAYDQFISGEAKGWTPEEIVKLDPRERDRKAREYAGNIARLTLTAGKNFDRSALQKIMVGRLFTQFWNDARNQLNGTMHSVNEIRWFSKEALAALKAGDTGKVRKALAGLNNEFMSVVVAAMVNKMIVDVARGQFIPVEELEPLNEDSWRMVGESAYEYFAGAPIDLFMNRYVDQIPLARDISFSALSPWQRAGNKDVNIPFLRTAEDISETVAATPQIIGMAGEYLGFVNDTADLNERQIRAVVRTAGLAIGGIPENGYHKGYEMIDNWTNGALEAFSPVDYFLEQYERFKDLVEESPNLFSKEFIQEVDQLKEAVSPPTADEEIVPDIALEAIKTAVSGGDWMKRNPVNNAAGVYQFTPEAWERIRERAPELNLTENGRVSKSSAQQERAMEWQTKQNMAALRREGVTVTPQSIYAAHVMGLENAVKILKAPGDTKIKTLVSVKLLEAQELPVNLKAKDFKNWLTNSVVVDYGEQ